MNKILSKRKLSENVNEYVLEAPLIAKHAKAGQFIILRVDEDGERVPFTLCDMDRTKGTITLLIQSIGYSTHRLAELNEGDYIHDVAGPLGNATDLSEFGRILLVGGGIGVAVIYPQAKYLRSTGKAVDAIIGARNQSLIMYESEMKEIVDTLYIMTDDGSYSQKGFVTEKLRELINGGEKYDAIFAVGPLMMMKAVTDVTREYGIKTIISMNSVMVDGTGMCGCCRLTVGGETKYACVDGPEFDGHLVDFAEAASRQAFYKEQEKEHMCRLRGKQ
ncbi:MAG: sulfide/dihydroorotate dehydrogenase-like FAD/NAD-binding protein [Clostridia bacterium]|nr:sulfide/dihydroorotate dehydrogenase-like FAD/NAD-binding protein [Clostridia bacterium]